MISDSRTSSFWWTKLVTKPVVKICQTSVPDQTSPIWKANSNFGWWTTQDGLKEEVGMCFIQRSLIVLCLQWLTNPEFYSHLHVGNQENKQSIFNFGLLQLCWHSHNAWTCMEMGNCIPFSSADERKIVK